MMIQCPVFLEFSFGDLYENEFFFTINRQVLELGFDEKFVRTWEYYFSYCAAGFKTRTIGNYQVFHKA